MSFDFFMPTPILFGPDRLNDLASTPRLPAGERAMIVITRGGSMLTHGYYQRVQGLLGERGVAAILCDQISPNPESDEVEAAAAAARDKDVDLIVGLGGGSAMDAAKAIALLAANGGEMWDYMAGGTGKGQTPEKAGLPVVAVPTTAGTGSEADPWFVLTKTGSREKIGWGCDATFPALAVVDSKLMLSVPPETTALTGMDAFFHAAESYLTMNRQPASDLMALEAASLIAGTLPELIAAPDNLELRTVMAWCSTSAGVCETLAGCTGLHSLAHAVGALHPDVPHGAALTAMSRAWFRIMAEADPGRVGDLAMALDQAAEEPAGTSEPEDFHPAFEELLAACGLAHLGLADLGVTEDEIEELADNALWTMPGLLDATPVELDKEALMAILAASLRGFEL
ncbi:MAG: iron-containing alcohol dehydrogenase [Desulfovibrionaceae bacterium]